MKYLMFSDELQVTYRVCFLVPELNRKEMRRHYVSPYLDQLTDQVLAYDLYKEPKRTPVKQQKEYLSDLIPILQDLAVEYLVVTDADYFKTLTGKPKAEAYLGYVVDSVLGNFKVLFCPDYRRVFYDPVKINADIALALTALNQHIDGTYIDPGFKIIKHSAYPQTLPDIKYWLNKLIQQDLPLAADIEAFSLHHHDAGIGSIAFAWSKHEGIAFPVDLHPESKAIRALLKDFFLKFQPKILWHNISYDVYVLVYQLFMEDLLDRKGMLFGMRTLLRNWDCTKLITYLATNSCSGNKLGLKEQAKEFAGNYAVEDIKDITKIPLPQLLEYNLIDTFSTWHVYEKHWDSLVQDNQLEIYETLFQPAILDIIQMQLTGLPLDMDEVLKLQIQLQEFSDKSRERMNQNPVVHAFIDHMNREWVIEKNLTYKYKRVTLEDANEEFNPNSGPQLQKLLYSDDFLSLPVLDQTESGQPAVGADTLEKLKNHTEDPLYLDLLDALLDFKSVDKILTSFIPAFLKAPKAKDGHHYLYGSFNLGGTVSGRLSSSNPNLQNLPSSGTKWAKAVKKCFRAPKGWLFVGLDFSSLEDRISALTTKDPNKLKVYTDEYDGHCLRAYSYFEDQMPDIDPNSVDSINSIAKKYKGLRQDSKLPTFLLTYGGTWHGIVEQLGWPEEKAKKIEQRYHDLYKVSDDWVAAKIYEAGQTGYVTAAFGLRVRTPILRQVVLGNRATPWEASSESRTAGNALGQSWCLLNSRAGSEFMSVVRSSKYQHLIQICAQIHDASYYLIPDDMEILQFVNEHLVKAVNWQDHPDIWHDEVKLGGELSVFYPSWAEELTIPNQASSDDIKVLAADHYNKYCGG